MKKFIVMVLVLMLVLSLAGCGDKVNQNLSEDTVAALEAAIETLDAFLKYDLTAEEAEKKFDRIVGSLPDTEEFYDQMAKLELEAARSKIASYAIIEGSQKRLESIGASSSSSNSMSGIRSSRDGLLDTLYGK